MKDREECRDALAALLTAELTGSGRPVQAVYNHKVGDFQNQSPVVVLVAGGSIRPRQTFASNATTFYFVLGAWVLYASEDGSWTEADAEDRLDLIEQQIAGMIEANQEVPPYWISLDYDDRSQIVEVALGGKPYLLEIIPLKMEV